MLCQFSPWHAENSAPFPPRWLQCASWQRTWVIQGKCLRRFSASMELPKRSIRAQVEFRYLHRRAGSRRGMGRNITLETSVVSSRAVPSEVFARLRIAPGSEMNVALGANSINPSRCSTGRAAYLYSENARLPFKVMEDVRTTPTPFSEASLTTTSGDTRARTSTHEAQERLWAELPHSRCSFSSFCIQPHSERTTQLASL